MNSIAVFPKNPLNYGNYETHFVCTVSLGRYQSGENSILAEMFSRLFIFVFLRTQSEFQFHIASPFFNYYFHFVANTFLIALTRLAFSIFLSLKIQLDSFLRQTGKKAGNDGKSMEMTARILESNCISRQNLHAC